MLDIAAVIDNSVSVMTQTDQSYPPSKRRLAEVLLEAKGIDLSTWLIEKRAEGLSLEKIARDLYMLTGGEIGVTLKTVGRWIEDYELEEAAS